MFKDCDFGYTVEMWTKRYKKSGLCRPYEDGTFVADSYRLGDSTAVFPLSECPLTKGYILECLKDWNINRLTSRIELLYHYADIDVDITNSKPFYIICVTNCTDGRTISINNTKSCEVKMNRSVKVNVGDTLTLDPHKDYQNYSTYLVCYA
jgi:hypothetical protein